MSVVTFSCPECGKVLKSSKATPAGKKIKCPTCAAVFAMPAHEDDELATGVSTRPRPVGAVSVHRNDDRPRRRPLDEDEEDRPCRKTTATAKKRGGLALLLAGVGAVVVLFAVGAGFGAYYIWFAGVNRGSGNEEPLAFVPAGTQVLAGVDGAALLGDPVLAPQIEKALRDEVRAADFIDSVKKEAGLEPKELFAKALACTDLDTLNQVGVAGGGGPPGAAGAARPKSTTVILRPSRPFDQKKIARACKDPVRKTAHGKYYYEVHEGDVRTLFMPSDRTLILSTLSAGELDALFTSDGTTPSVSGDAVALVRGAGAATYWTVVPFQGDVRSKLDEEVRAGKGNDLNPLQPVLEQVATGKGIAAWGTLEGERVKLGVDLLCADPAAATAMAQATDKSWSAQKFQVTLLLLGLRFQMPRIGQLLSELTGSLKFAGEGTTARATAAVGRATLVDAIVEGQKMQNAGGPFGGFNAGPGFGPPGGFPNPGGVPNPGGIPNPRGGRPGGR